VSTAQTFEKITAKANTLPLPFNVRRNEKILIENGDGAYCSKTYIDPESASGLRILLVNNTHDIIAYIDAPVPSAVTPQTKVVINTDKPVSLANSKKQTQKILAQMIKIGAGMAGIESTHELELANYSANKSFGRNLNIALNKRANYPDSRTYTMIYFDMTS
jgi:hypothetical protein